MIRVTQATFLLLIVALTCIVVGCGGGGDNGGGNDAFTLNKHTMNCPADTLIISDQVSPPPANSTVTFKNKDTGQTYDGGATVIDGQVYCGFPSGAPAGTYQVILNEPGTFGIDVGDVTYTLNSC